MSSPVIKQYANHHRSYEHKKEDMMLNKYKLSTRLTIGFLICAIITFIVGGTGVYYTNYVGDQGTIVGERLAPQVDGVMEVKLLSTEAHLIFEEIVAGESEETVADVHKLLDKAIWYCDAVAYGGSNDEGTFIASDNPEVVSKMMQVKNEVNAFKQSVSDRQNLVNRFNVLFEKSDETFNSVYTELILELLTQVGDQRKIETVRSLAYASTTVANAHVGLEEAMADDALHEKDEVTKKFTGAFEVFSNLKGDMAYTTFSELEGLFKEILNQVEERFALLQEKINTANGADAIFDKQFTSFITEADEAETLIQEGMQVGRDNLNSGKSTAAVMMLIFSIVGFVVAISLGYFLARSITLPINEIIDNLQDGADQVKSASSQVSSSSQNMAQGAAEQASGIEEIAASIEELTAMTTQNAKNSKEASGLSSEAGVAAGKGQVAVDKMMETVQEIKTSSDETAKVIKNINEIAFQTNLLALNAAVEAARAGDAGKGFAVVAEEVRNLAQRSAEAANNTAALIEQSQNSADKGVGATEEVTQTLEGINTVINKVNGLVQDVSASSDEQAASITQVNTSVTSMDQVVQSNSATAEESAAASEELSSQAIILNEVVEKLAITINGINFQTGLKLAPSKKLVMANEPTCEQITFNKSQSKSISSRRQNELDQLAPATADF